METKFTKAPWAWQKFGADYNLTAQHGMREIIIGAQKGKHTSIPFVAMNKDGIMRAIDPAHPNAKLIAAAPELLEALQQVLSWLEQDGRGESVLANNCRNAIKKATD